MMIGRTRVAVGPLRDLGHLDALMDAIRGVRGVGDVAVDAFVGRRAHLAVQVLHPVDLSGAVADALGIGDRACRIEGGRLEVRLADDVGDDPRGATPVADEDDEAEAVDATAVLDDADRNDATAVLDDAERVDATATSDDEGAGGHATPASTGEARPVATTDVLPATAGEAWPVAARTTRVGAVSSAPFRALPAGAVIDAEGPDPLELLELSFAHAPVATAIVDRVGRLVRVNHRLRDLLGRDDAALLGLRVEDLVEPVTDTADERLAVELETGRAGRWSAVRRFPRPDGSVVPTRLQAAAVRDPEGVPRWYVVELIEGVDVRPAPVRVGAAV